MKTTIDKAGRVVVPAPLREKLGLRAGTQLELIVEDLSIRLTRCVPGPTLERVGQRLVVRPAAPPEHLPEVDVAALIEEERDRWPP
jgi:AbrB family looped-hinge helix DNA binding protein